MLIGTIADMASILAGSAAGLLLRRVIRSASAGLSEKRRRLGRQLQDIIMQGLALCTTCMGISGALKGENSLMMILSMVIGACVGTLLDLDGAISRAGDWIQAKMSGLSPTDGSASISEGFVTASLLYCVGAMSIVGALNSGLAGDHDMLFAKALLDGVSSIIFSASLGVGVAFSAIAVFLCQAPITLAASLLAPFLSDAVVAEMTCVGSLMILAISLNMLGLTRIKVMDMLPAIFLPVLLFRSM